MQVTHKVGIGASAIVILVAVVAGATTLWKRSHSDSEIAVVAPLDVSCDLQRNDCQGVFPDGSRITLSILPRPIRALQPLRIEVVVEGVDPRAVAVDFSGVGMYMGYNRTRLTKQSSGAFAGSGMLSVCTRDRMAWEATVLAETEEGVMAAPFRFDVLRP
jgi:hypothetical protein